MRQVGDILYVGWKGAYYGEKCKVTKVNRKKDRTTYDIELLEKQDSWLRAEEGKKVTLHFSNVPYGELKGSI